MSTGHTGSHLHRMRDPRMRRAVSLGAAAVGALLALPATGWLETLAVVTAGSAVVVNAQAYLEVWRRSRASTRSWRRRGGYSWWNDLDDLLSVSSRPA